MNCPKCVGSLADVRYGDEILIQRCDQCAGLFCAPEMLEAMKREYLSEAVLDIGNPRVGSKLDKVDDIACPRCGICMTPTYDPAQTHIWYELCENCGSTWLDAGEFTDLKYETLMDRVRGFLRGKRPRS